MNRGPAQPCGVPGLEPTPENAIVCKACFVVFAPRDPMPSYDSNSVIRPATQRL